jgi:hypothetical protein
MRCPEAGGEYPPVFFVGKSFDLAVKISKLQKITGARAP